MIELRVDAPADAGQCVGRVDGRAVFVTGALPGELVRAEVTLEKRRFSKARTVAVLEASQHRVGPDCPWFAECGGCTWLHADAGEQNRIKTAVLGDQLERIGGVRWPVTVRSLGRQSQWRTRVTFHGDGDRGGFFAAGSHDVVDIGYCLQAVAGLELAGLLARPWPTGATVHASVSEAGRAVRWDDGLEGVHEHTNTVLGRVFHRSADGFWQAHVDAPEVLASAVRALVEPVDSIVDLYAGVGLFGLTLLDVMPEARVTLVEADPTAARFARRNAAGRARVLAVDARRWRPEVADLVVLDPPRSGAGEQVVRAIGQARPSTVIYVSCDAGTLARDLRLFTQIGYIPDHIEGFDLFPGTAHVETVVRLRRS